jgi:hypothetical protein
MANKGWSKTFDEPIVLDDGTTLTPTPMAPTQGQCNARRAAAVSEGI